MLQGGPVGPDGRLSPFFSDPAGPAGFAGGPAGPYGTLSPSDSDPAGPDGPYVAGGPVGPDGTLSPFSLARLALQVALLARMGRCPRLNLILLAQMAHMFQMARWAHLGHCPRLTPVGYSPWLTLHLVVRYLRVRKDGHRVRMVWGPLPGLLWWAGMPIRYNREQSVC